MDGSRDGALWRLGRQLMERIKVAIWADFLGAYAKLPGPQQRKVSAFVTNFQRNPKAPGTNFEKIQAARDPHIRSVRIDQDYRGIVLAPERGDVYILLWVDKHDDAYDWARRHRCPINPETGSIQVCEVEPAVPVQEAEATAASAAAPAAPPAFAGVRDKALLRLGVPEPMLGAVREIRDEAGLDGLQGALPVEAYEGLFLLLAGSSAGEILADRELAKAEKVDTGDFSKALETPDSRSRFVVVEDELELAAVLNAPLEKWRVFLHPSQRRLVEGVKSGPVRVLGGAGTGKTVVAMHRARWLADQLASQGDGKVLFTTFTKNLATDIEENLKSLCSPAQMARIEVANLDSWVHRFLRKRRYEYTIAYGADLEPYWKKALDLKPLDPELPDAFFREEWQRVIQPQGVGTLEQYVKASRVGRGTRLNRAQRVALWAVFEEYRNQLALNHRKEIDDAYRDAAALLQHEGLPPPYAAVVVDEAQDMGPQAFNLLRALVASGPNDLFIVGDGHQRIYGRNKVVLSKCGIDIRGRSKKLRVSYRTTEEIRRWAVRLLEGLTVDDLDGGVDSNDGYRSLTHGVAPVIHAFETEAQQLEFIRRYLGERAKGAEPAGHVCIVARTNAELDKLQRGLEGAGTPVSRINPNEPDRAGPEVPRLATLHRVKGLEFDCVILASVNAGLVPLTQAVGDKGDEVEARQADLEERALVYVGITRAKKEAVVLSYGVPSPYIRVAV
jgi:hypothetical protein